MFKKYTLEEKALFIFGTIVMIIFVIVGICACITVVYETINQVGGVK